MSDDITGLCDNHSFETADGLCRRCGLEFCELCLVHPFGDSRPFCKECAMAQGGVRAHVQRSPMARRELRRRVKAFDRRQSHTTDLTAAEEPELRDPLVPPGDDPEPVPATVPQKWIRGEATAESADAPLAGSGSAAADPADGVAPAIDWSQPFG